MGFFGAFWRFFLIYTVLYQFIFFYTFYYFHQGLGCCSCFRRRLVWLLVCVWSWLVLWCLAWLLVCTWSASGLGLFLGLGRSGGGLVFGLGVGVGVSGVRAWAFSVSGVGLGLGLCFRWSALGVWFLVFFWRLVLLFSWCLFSWSVLVLVFLGVLCSLVVCVWACSGLVSGVGLHQG